MKPIVFLFVVWATVVSAQNADTMGFAAVDSLCQKLMAEDKYEEVLPYLQRRLQLTRPAADSSYARSLYYLADNAN